MINEIYDDLNRLKKIKQQLPNNNETLDQMIQDKEEVIAIHSKEITIQHGQELITELFGAATAKRMGVI